MDYTVVLTVNSQWYQQIAHLVPNIGCNYLMPETTILHFGKFSVLNRVRRNANKRNVIEMPRRAKGALAAPSRRFLQQCHAMKRRFFKYLF